MAIRFHGKAAMGQLRVMGLCSEETVSWLLAMNPQTVPGDSAQGFTERRECCATCKAAYGTGDWFQ
jgi:hypothetical protein